MSDDKVIPLFNPVTMQLRSCDTVIERLESAVAAQEATDDDDSLSARFNRVEREAAEVARSLRQLLESLGRPDGKR